MSEERFVYTQGQTLESVGNGQVAGGVCALCRYRTARAGRCEKYPAKPLDILAGRAVCTYYEPDVTALDGQEGKCEGEEPLQPDEAAPQKPYKVEFPPCVGCVHNAGALACAALGSKPERVVIGHEPCGRREEEHA